MPKLMTKPMEFAPGIPKARKIEDVPRIGKSEEWTLAVQRHFAERAGEHLDLRLVDPKGRAHSWALPKAKLPKPGERPVLAIPQPTHTAEYALTAGKDKEHIIESGYGKGRVKMDLQSPVEVLPSTKDTVVKFNLYTGRGPQEFAIVQPHGQAQLLINTTKTRESMPHMPWGAEKKPKMRLADPAKIDFDDNAEYMMPKYDGAHTLVDLGRQGSMPRIFSYRLPRLATAGVIEHTHKVPLLMEKKVPKELEGTVLRAELVGVGETGRSIPATTLGGMLNASVPKARELQEKHKAHLVPVIFDVVRYRGEDVSQKPFVDRLNIVRTVAKKVGLQATEVAGTRSEKEEMLRRIHAGEHPLTSEGVVLKPVMQHGPPTKVKFRPDHDVYVREIFPAIGKDRQPLDRAGGFRYSHSPTGPILGSVGTGFDHALARDMLANPAKYVGRAAKVEAEKKFESGALSKPSFIEWHLEKGKIIEKIAEVKTELKPHQKRVIQRIKAQPGLVVAHGMGSGKTLSAIAAAEDLGGPTSVTVPASLQTNFQKELKKHVSGAPKADYSLESLQRAALTQDIKPSKLHIVDEAHRIRDPASAARKAVRGAETEKRLLLTGTPLYNRPYDLASLVNVAAGNNVFPGAQADFDRRYIGEKVIKPGWFARTFRGVKPGAVPTLKNKGELSDLLGQWVDFHENNTENFPARQDEVVNVTMSPQQREVYDTLMKTAPAWVRYKVRRGLPPTKQESKELNAFLSGTRQVSDSPAGFREGVSLEDAAAQSPKLQEAVQRLTTRIGENPSHRAVVYSNFLESGLHPYEALLKEKGVPYGKFTGELGKAERDAMVKAYNAGDLKALLLSSAGGEGLDLKGTRQIQVLEPHFNREKLEQVIARGIRFGSHEHLPEDQRRVDVEHYVSQLPEPHFLRKLFGAKRHGSTDEYLRTLSSQKDELNQQVREILRAQTEARSKTAGVQELVGRYSDLVTSLW